VPVLHFFLTSSPIFAVVLAGWLAARLRLVPAAGFSAFSTYAFDLALPALLVGLLGRQPIARTFDARFLAALLAAGTAVFAATLAASLLLPRQRPPLRVAAAHAQAATGGNLGFLGVPLLLALLGDAAAGPIGMGMVAEVGLLMPLGIVLMGMRRGGAARGVAREVALATVANPIVASVAVGVVLGVTGWRLPGPVDRFLAFVGPSAGPTALFALGGTLAGRRLGPHWRPVAAVAVVKLAVYPALAWSLLRVSGVQQAWVAAGTLIAALPTAAYVFVFAERHDALPERVSAEILLSTAAAAFTFPIAAWLVLP
jgi:hypothetical protein